MPVPKRRKKVIHKWTPIQTIKTQVYIIIVIKKDFQADQLERARSSGGLSVIFRTQIDPDRVKGHRQNWFCVTACVHSGAHREKREKGHSEGGKEGRIEREKREGTEREERRGGEEGLTLNICH